MYGTHNGQTLGQNVTSKCVYRMISVRIALTHVTLSFLRFYIKNSLHLNASKHYQTTKKSTIMT